MSIVKLDIDEEAYFKLIKSANDNNMSVGKHIETMQAKFTNIEQTFDDFTQLEVDHFKVVLFHQISEILESQEELAKSNEGTVDDKIMVDILNILFGRATRDKVIYSEMCNKYYELLRKY
ncbi:hypothetical protein [Peptostreptococcus sp.]|mgnify:CR=1 FL=1|jgi:hypothetical protein|uniref:hypothetical protein n=1 Tax=Peptostreptococcus sp. TaxID=1262 RepID=UPI00204BD9F4|nr:MAG TPA: hypothetical protein [Caudoviricetes sp.]